MRYAALLSAFVFGTTALVISTSGKEEKGDSLLQRDLTLGHSGNYRYVGCDEDQGQAVTTALQTLWRTLLPVVPDAKGSGSHRTAAYETFIKDSSRAEIVADIITNITIGTALHAPTPPWSDGSPTFVCVKPKLLKLNLPDGTKVDAYDNCIAEGHGASYLHPTPFILLCPVFWQLPASPPADICPVMNRRTNHYVRKPIDDDIAGSSIWQNHVWIVFHEIVHYYLYAYPGYVEIRPEVYNINQCWKLAAADAWRNSENHVYFAATTAAKCTQWPTLPENERELLEGGDVGPADPADDVDVSDAAAEDVMEVTSAELLAANTSVAEGAGIGSNGPGKTPNCAPGLCYNWCICE